MSCMDDVSFACIDEAEDNAFDAWNNLLRKYEPATGAQLIQTKREFHGSTLKQSQDPDEWMVELERKRNLLKKNFKSPIDDEYFIIHVVNNLTDQYEDLVVNFTRQMDSKVEPLTVISMKNQIQEKYNRF